MNFRKKADSFKRPLNEKLQAPVSICLLRNDNTAFQRVLITKKSDFALPITLNSGDEVLLDFGDHIVGYLSFALAQPEGSPICDSPVKLRFFFGEFPLEIATPPENYHGTLGNGWLQNEERSYSFLPAKGALERRYAFRYLRIVRTDNAYFPITFTDIFSRHVSAADPSGVTPPELGDDLLERIYTCSLKTLCHCEQDVFEDGPKRDRRMWMGDFRLQALTDHATLKNVDLVKRCLYLFAAHRSDNGLIAPCIFPDSPPYINDYFLMDYSLLFISCLHDYVLCYNDTETLSELYPIALRQAEICSGHLDKSGLNGVGIFIDWCPELDKQVAAVGVYVYALNHLLKLANISGKDTEWITKEIDRASAVLLGFRREDGLFVPPSGQISQHSQIWAILSGIIKREESIALIRRVNGAENKLTLHTPYAYHYYIEALYKCGLFKEALDVIKNYWGEIVKCCYDCCPEIFNPNDHLESPYAAPEINSACHAWSCTPAYWLPMLTKLL